MNKVLSILFAAAVLSVLASCSKSRITADKNTVSDKAAKNNAAVSTEENSVSEKSVDPVTHDGFMRAKAGADIIVEGYLQAWTYDTQNGYAGLFIMNDEGSFYAYKARCDDLTSAGFTEGAGIRITGKKAYRDGFHMIDEGAAVELIDGNMIYPAVEIGEEITDISAMTKLQGARVAVKRATVVAPDTLADGKDAAFLYGPDGSGLAGSNSDLYIYLQPAGMEDAYFTFKVESDEIAEGSGTYTAATELSIGDVIDIEGFMYWDHGPQIHIHSITKVGTNKLVSGEGFTYREFVESAPESDIIVEGYLQFLVYNAKDKNACLFISNDDGSFYSHNAVCDDELAERLARGVKVRVTGRKALSEGFHQIADGAEIEILEGSRIYPPVDISANLNNIDEMTRLQASGVKISNAKVVPQDLDGEEVSFLYGPDGSGAAGTGSDLYLRLQSEGIDGEYTVIVKADETSEDSDVYRAVTALANDATVDIEGFMFWSDGPQVHVYSITVK